MLLHSLRRSIRGNTLLPSLSLGGSFAGFEASSKRVLECGDRSLLQKGYASALVQLDDESRPHLEDLKPGKFLSSGYPWEMNHCKIQPYMLKQGALSLILLRTSLNHELLLLDLLFCC